jgi:flagellar biosynthesis/type III secretory pathway chaperone
MFKKLKRWLKRSLLARLWRERQSRLKAEAEAQIAIEKWQDGLLRYRVLASHTSKLVERIEYLERRNRYLEMSLGKKEIPNELPKNFN